MGYISAAILEAVMIAASCSLDAFAVSLSYGSDRIKIPFGSACIINVISCLILGVSLFIGSAVRTLLPVRMAVIACFIILIVIGIGKLLDCLTKSLIRRNKNISKEVKFSMFNFKFILTLYADPEKADVDFNKTISASEAAALAVSLSLDGLAVGFGAALGNVNIPLVFAVSFIVGVIAIYLGRRIGEKIAGKLPFSPSWLSGAVLIALAVIKLY
jgi:putative sporulation protein YtaF